MTITITGHSLSLDQVVHVARNAEKVALDGAALEAMGRTRAIVDEVLEFKMPGFGIPGFRRKAAEVAKAGIYDIRGHRDEVVMPLLNYWKVFEVGGLNPIAEEKRRQLAHHLELLDRSAKKAEERREEERITAEI